MWNAIANMIIKASDNINRGVENAATDTGNGNNGQGYQFKDSNAAKGEETSAGSSSVGGYTAPEQSQSTSGVESATSAMKNVSSMAKTAISNIANKGETAEEKKPDDVSAGGEDKKPIDIGGAGETKEVPTDVGGIGGAGGAGGIGGAGAITSDERLKRIFGENPDAIKCFSKLESIKFTYNDKAKEIHPEGENGVDNDTHYGVKAQELERNPYTKSAVSEDAAGFKQIDPKELTAANTAVISEVCRRLLLIEKVLGLEVK